MTPQAKSDNALMRQALARRIVLLRANKHVWRPGAPRADQSCRRSEASVELASVHGHCSLAELVDAAVARGRTDFEAVQVHCEEQSVPYEDYTVTVTVLSTSEKLTDEGFAAQIDVLWQQYQLALQKAAGRDADYASYLRLKEVFEPNR
jgi:hypothetical protein